MGHGFRALDLRYIDIEGYSRGLICGSQGIESIPRSRVLYTTFTAR